MSGAISTTNNLEDLRDQLTRALEDLNQNFVQLFNNNYDQFIQLSLIITRLKQPLDKIIQPLDCYKDELTKLCQQFDDYIAIIDDKQNQLIETCRHKHIVSRFIQLVKRRDQLERLFEDIDWTVGVGSTQQQQQSKQQTKNILQFDLLERVNVELYYLSKELNSIESLDELYQIRRHIETSLNSRQKQLDTWFESAFLEAVDLDNNFHIDLVVRTYEQKDAIKKLDSVFRSNVVYPYLSKLISDSNVIKDLDILFNQIEQFIDNKTDLIHCEFAKQCCWEETLNLLEKSATLYSLDNLELFNKRLAKTRDFLLRNKLDDGQCNQVLNKFNLKLYLQQRSYQITTGVEESLNKEPLKQLYNNEADTSSTTNNATTFNLNATHNIYHWVNICWTPDIYIPQLHLEFQKLVCQVLDMFALWLSKLRLSDFKIQGHKQTNFLAEHKALMALLIDDCDLLIKSVKRHESMNNLYNDSFNQINKGLANVYSLQKLIEK